MSGSSSLFSGSETIPQILLQRLVEEPEAEACRLVSRDGTVEIVSVRRLLDKALAYASRYGRPDPDRKIVGVCLYHSLDLHAAFLGGLLSGHIPTMLPPPSPRMEIGKYSDSFIRMIHHLRPDFMVLDSFVHSKLTELSLGKIEGTEIITPEAIPDSGPRTERRADPDEIALLQHSSGTTGLQKGIALSHRAILHHNQVYRAKLGITRDDVIVSWLPLYHDMGFIACFLLPILSGVRFVEMSPFDWVTHPVMLLEQIWRQRGTLCWLPNFSFNFMAQTIRPSQVPPGLDLSSIRAWINSSETVYHSSNLAFLNRFQAGGVRPDQITASYAMAENVYGVTQTMPGSYRTLSADRKTFTDEHRVIPGSASDALIFVSNGPPVEGTEVRILDEQERPLPPDQVGELALRGPHRFAGYFRRDDLTRQAMTGDGWYKTGDLGFVHEGEIYVTGRKKDLIIIQGRNFYPSDLEESAAKVEGVVPGRVVAFGLPEEKSGTERLIILAEAEAPAPADEKMLALKIRQRVAQDLDCTPSEVRLVPPRWLIKSTSGKIARRENREKYLRTFAKPG